MVKGYRGFFGYLAVILGEKYRGGREGGMNTELHIEKFLSWLHLQNYACPTTKLYRNSLNIFKDYLRPKHDLRSVTTADLRNYQQMVLGKPWVDTTKVLRLSQVRRFFKYLSESGLILQNPLEDMEIPHVKQRQKLPQVLSVDEMRDLLSLPFDKQWLGLRDRAILELLYSSGLRSGELRGLEVSAVDLLHEEVFIAEGKGRKDRFVPLGHCAAMAIKRYIEGLRPRLEKFVALPPPQLKKLFLTKSGRPMSASDLALTLRRHVRSAHIGSLTLGSLTHGSLTLQKRVTPHLIRHTMATHLLENGLDIIFIQKMLGHKVLDTTMLYTHVDKTMLRKLHRQYHPRGKWRFRMAQ